MNRNDVIQAIDAAEAQLNQLADAIRLQAAARLPEGEWTVRDVLSHLAANANSIPFTVRRYTNPPASGAPRPNIDDINAGQVSERAGRGVDEVLEELRRGYAAAREAAHELTDELLSRPVTDFRGNPTTLGEVLRNAYAGHHATHLASINQATAKTDQQSGGA